VQFVSRNKSKATSVHSSARYPQVDDTFKESHVMFPFLQNETRRTREVSQSADNVGNYDAMRLDSYSMFKELYVPLSKSSSVGEYEIQLEKKPVRDFVFQSSS